MTTLTIFPLFSNSINMANLIKYATDFGFTVSSYNTFQFDSSTGQSYAILILVQVLTGAQQTAIQNIFNGAAYIKFT